MAVNYDSILLHLIEGTARASGAWSGAMRNAGQATAKFIQVTFP